MTDKKIMDTTDNNGVYNKARKQYLANSGKIHCSFCPYHKNENFTGVYFGFDYKGVYLYPNWKLTTKVRKQWMKNFKKIKMRNIS